MPHSPCSWQPHSSDSWWLFPAKVWAESGTLSVWLDEGAIFPSHARLVQSPPLTQPNLGLCGPDTLCWPHPDDSLRSCPTTKVCKHPAGGS